MYKPPKKGEFRLLDADETWEQVNPYKARNGWECHRCWQYYKRYSLQYTIETYSNEYIVCDTCVKTLGLIW